MLPFPPLTRQAKTLIPKDADKTPLLDYLAARFPYLSRERWQDMMREGRLRLDGQPADGETPVHLGQTLEFLVPGLPEPPVDWDIRTVAEKPPCLVLAKPANLPCHPAGHFFNHTIWAYLKQARHLPEVHFLNRLDRETSGLVIVAAEAAAAARLQRALAATGRKDYLVIVEGVFPDTFTAKGFLVDDTQSPVRKTRRFTAEPPPPLIRAESAFTEFRRLDASPDGRFSLLCATLQTGRLHQIRATLRSLGFPVVGDKLYGPDPALYLRFCDGTLSAEDRQRLIMPRQALHAWKTAVQWPGEQSVTEYIAAPPKDFLTACHTLGLAIPPDTKADLDP